MAVFLIDMADMFAAAYLMGILYEEISKKRIVAALIILIIYSSKILESVWFLSNMLLCEFFMLGLFMKGKLLQKFAWCMELQLMILIFDFLFKNLTLIIEQTGREEFGQYFNYQIQIIVRGMLIFVLVIFLWKKREYIIKIFGEVSARLSVYIIISMSVTILILCLVHICLRGILVEQLIPVFSIGMVLFSILLMGLCVIVRILIYSKKQLDISNEMNRQYIKQQKEYYEEIDKKNMELKSFRHDFNEHVYVMNDMAGRESIEELKEYLSNLSQKKKTVYYINTGNHVANAVVNRYYEMA